MLSSKALPVALALILFITGISAGPALLQSSDPGEFFEYTGHYVQEPLLSYINSSPDRYLLFGYPITEVEDHPLKQGVKVQYFQKARLEWDSNGDGSVQLAPLGEYLYDRLNHGEKADFAINNGACRMFQTTGKPVCYAFLQFYDANQGAKYFGEPISDVEILDNRLVQYFTYARMEWQPENDPGERVALTDVGRLYFDISDGDTTKTDAVSGGTSKPLSIQVYAFADRPLATSASRQRVFVIVRDQHKKPVPGALVMVEIHYPDGSVDKIRPDNTTNEDGFLEVGFNINSLQPNQIVNVIARANIVNGPEGSAETMFRIWW